MAQDGLAYFEPAYVDELADHHALGLRPHAGDGKKGQAPKGRSQGRSWERDAAGGSVYLRLSTRPLEQPKRTIDADAGARAHRRRLLAAAAGAGRASSPSPTWARCCRRRSRPGEALREDVPGAGLLAVTSADRLHAGWHAARGAPQGEAGGHLRRSSACWRRLAADAGLVTVLDGHPATLSWLGAVRGHRGAGAGRRALRPVGRHAGPLPRSTASTATRSSTPPPRRCCVGRGDSVSLQVSRHGRA